MLLLFLSSLFGKVSEERQILIPLTETAQMHGTMFCSCQLAHIIPEALSLLEIKFSILVVFSLLNKFAQLHNVHNFNVAYDKHVNGSFFFPFLWVVTKLSTEFSRETCKQKSSLTHNIFLSVFP